MNTVRSLAEQRVFASKVDNDHMGDVRGKKDVREDNRDFEGMVSAKSSGYV